MLRGFALSLGGVIEIRRGGNPIVLAVSARAVAQFYLTTSNSLLFDCSVIDILRTTPHIHIGAAT
jgi:hypothetical protein